MTGLGKCPRACLGSFVYVFDHFHIFLAFRRFAFILAGRCAFVMCHAATRMPRFATVSVYHTVTGSFHPPLASVVYKHARRGIHTLHARSRTWSRSQACADCASTSSWTTVPCSCPTWPLGLTMVLLAISVPPLVFPSRQHRCVGDPGVCDVCHRFV